MILAMGFLNPEETIPKQLGLQVDQVGASIDLMGWVGLKEKRKHGVEATGPSIGPLPPPSQHPPPQTKTTP